MKAAAAPMADPHPTLTWYQKAEADAIDVCQRLTKRQLRIQELGKTPDTKGYVLMRDFAKGFARNKAAYTRFLKIHCLGAIPAMDSDDECGGPMDPTLTTIAYLPSEIV